MSPQMVTVFLAGHALRAQWLYKANGQRPPGQQPGTNISGGPADTMRIHALHVQGLSKKRERPPGQQPGPNIGVGPADTMPIDCS